MAIAWQIAMIMSTPAKQMENHSTNESSSGSRIIVVASM
jgi:hypothetical protein